MLGFIGKYPAGQPKGKMLIVLRVSQKPAVKYSMGKPILLIFVNFSTTFCPRI